MKLVDLDQAIFVPVMDETHGGVVVEMKMTVGEFFEKCCAGFAPDAVEAIPIEWIRKQEEEPLLQHGVHGLLFLWDKEQEAQDG